MRDDTQDGGPAFPVVEMDSLLGTRVDAGMSLRDWFAGMAVVGHLSSDDQHYYPDLAHDCYKLADAMLSARKSKD